MAAKYDLFENPDNSTRKSGYHPRLLKVLPASEDEICKNISSSCSVTTADIAGVMEALYQSIIDNLMMGRKVYIPKLGRFSVTLEADNCETYKSNPRNLKVKKICFVPSKKLRESMNSMDFSRHRRLKDENDSE
ncbi:MAG: HU domain-containing protein [Bacteroidales bacterium]|nr:HU domain-containing protein [Bacteroidales bacterium]